MGACASRPKVLKEGGNAPVTREIEPNETVPADVCFGEKDKEVVEVEAKEEPETCGGRGVDGQNSRRSLEVLLNEVEAKEAEQIESKTNAEPKAPTIVVAERSIEVAEQPKAAQPVEKVEKPVATPVAEKPVVAIEQVKTAQRVEELEKPATTSVAEKPVAAAEQAKTAQPVEKNIGI